MKHSPFNDNFFSTLDSFNDMCINEQLARSAKAVKNLEGNCKTLRIF